MAAASGLHQTFPMTFTSPLPSVDVPATGVDAVHPGTRRPVGRQDRLHRRGHRPDDDVRRVRGRGAPAGGRLAGAWAREGRGRRRDGAQLSRVRRHLPRRRAGRRCASPRSTRRTRAGEVHHQLVDSGATLPRDDPDVPRDGRRPRSPDSAVKEVYVIGEADGYASIASLVRRAARRTGAGRSRRRRRAAVLLGHDRPGEGRHAHAPQPRREHRADARHGRRCDEDDAFVAVLPFFHIYGMQVLMNLGLRAGATIVTMPRFDLEQFLSLHQEHRLTRAFVAPPMVVALAKHPVVDNYDLSALRWILSGAAPLSAELAIECGERLGCEVVQGYGMTELSPVSHATPSGRFKPGSVGVTVPNTEVDIVDPADAVAARRRRGRRGVGARPAGDEGLPEQRGRDEEHDRRRRLAAHRRHRPHRRRRAPVHRRPAEGAHQVQGLPGAARRARGAAAHASRRSRMPP